MGSAGRGGAAFAVRIAVLGALCELAGGAPVQARERGARDGAPRVTIVAEPWGAPFTAADLASALRLRLPDAGVSVVAPAPTGDGSARSVTVRWLDAPSVLRVERGSGDAVEFPLPEGGRGGADPALITRRAALVIALFAEEGARLVDAAPGEVGTPQVGAAPVVGTTPAPPGRPAPAGWAVGAQLGTAVAVEHDELSSTEALTLRARRYLAPGTAVEIGAKLSGEYTTSAGAQAVGVADRALFAGVSYEAWLTPRLAIELGAGLQYTHPVVDIDGEGPVSGLDAPASTRFAVRTGVGLVWSPAEHLTAGISATTSFSLRDREYVDGSGREVIGLGSMILDLTVGAGARW